MPDAKPILFTPGPVRTPPIVAEYLANPPCNYHRQDAFRSMFEQNERDLKTLVGIENPDAYYATTITSTGTGANEACLLSLAPLGRGLMISNGFFGARLLDQARQNELDVLTLELPTDRPIDVAEVRRTLDENPDLKWAFFVSHETRLGMVNPVEAVGTLCKERGLVVGADLISSSFAYAVDIEAAQLDLSVASSAKALQAAPGIGIIFVRLETLPSLEAAGPRRGYYMDVVAETRRQQSGNETRFAQPVVLHASIAAACKHMLSVGIDNHYARVQRQMKSLIDHLAERDVPPLLEEAYRSNIAVNFRLPATIPYAEFAKRMIEEGYYLLYGIPGDQTHFQVSTIGDLSDEHIEGLKAALDRVLATH